MSKRDLKIKFIRKKSKMEKIKKTGRGIDVKKQYTKFQ